MNPTIDNRKIVGGYTPLRYHRENLKGDYTGAADPSRESFMFSLTNNEKFFLIAKNSAIYLRKNKDFICFGYA